MAPNLHKSSSSKQNRHNPLTLNNNNNNSDSTSSSIIHDESSNSNNEEEGTPLVVIEKQGTKREYGTARSTSFDLPLTSAANEDNNNNNNAKTVMKSSLSSLSRSSSKNSDNRNRNRRVLMKTQSSFWEDASQFNQGSIPHSIVLSFVIGVTCGIACWIYYNILFFVLEYVWHTLPSKIVINNNVWPEYLYVLWIPIVGFTMSLGVGLTVKYIGEPGDLAYTIKCVHDKAYVAMSHVLPMVAASQFSIIGGGSLGPEAPLVAICASLGGFVSRRIFGCTNRNLVRKHTLMGMAGALAAFFGAPLGGSLFAMEVNSRFGIEYFEHTVEAVFAGEVCLAVFRGLANLPIEPIWEISDNKLDAATPMDIVYAVGLGLVGALTAYFFAQFHQRVMYMFEKFGLLINDHAIYRALLGAVVIVLLGMLVPHSMFWGEFEIQTIGTMSRATTLEHIWPTTGLIGFEMDSAFTSFIVGVTKLIAISFTVAGGYRGGFIFPAMASGVALGHTIHFICPFIPIQLCCLCMAGAINVAITRTAIATTLILTYLSGEQNAISAILASCLISLFATGYMPFIKTQMARADIDTSLYHHDDDDDDVAHIHPNDEEIG